MAGDGRRECGMIAARQIAFGGSANKWENPYITDGLVAMWDGEWNAGWRKHDPSTTVWKDLVGIYDAQAEDSPVFGDSFSDTSNGCWKLPDSIIPIVEVSDLCVEVVFKTSFGGAPNQGIIGIGNERASWIFFGNPPDYSNATLEAQLQKSATIRIWFYQGQFPLGVHTVSVIKDDSVCNAYLDSSKRTSNIMSGSQKSTGMCYIGKMYGFNKFNGNIYSVRIYSRALTAEEIAYNYNIDKQRFGL
jgi:hypothetical protein